MRVLIISHLFADIASGPSWSVPAYAESLSRIDSVIWINTIDATLPHWNEINCFHKLSDFGRLKLSSIYGKSEKPDIVVFQGFNFIEHAIFAINLRHKGVPYIIVPRGSLAYDAVHNHAWLKKWVAHKILLDRYVKKASALQYLTEEEKKESGDYWNSHYFVLGNGFSNDSFKTEYSEASINGLFIGRLDMHHKGIDILVDAVECVAEEMRGARFTIDFYGPEKFDSAKLRDIIRSKSISDILRIHGPISGDEKRSVLLKSDVFFLTSRFEGHPMGLIEALSYGIPALVTEGSNMMSKIEAYDAGWPSKQNNKETISATILRVIKERSSLKEKGQNARKLSLEYDWNLLAERLHTELERIILK